MAIQPNSEVAVVYLRLIIETVAVTPLFIIDVHHHQASLTNHDPTNLESPCISEDKHQRSKRAPQ